jgi:hypothetical protein
MASVYVNNLIVNSGSDFDQSFTLESMDSSSNLNLTGYTIEAQLRKHAGSSTSVSFATTAVSPLTSGKIKLSLTSSETTDIKPGRYVYDVVIEKDLIRTRVIEGMVLVREGVTR